MSKVFKQNNKNMNIISNVDDEWEKFMTGNDNSDDTDSDNLSYYDEDNENNIINEMNKLNINEKKQINDDEDDEIIIIPKKSINLLNESPKSSDIYISTKTKIAYLNKMIDLKNIFWEINVIPYTKACNGVIKKQMKFNSTREEEVNLIKEKLKNERYFDEYIMTSINNPNGRIKFKDIRKISVGISKKDLTSYRCKQKSAFYNCFVLILRLKINDIFKEFHVKVFNTGKLEIPGIQNEETFQLILSSIIDILKPFVKNDPEIDLNYRPETTETVLINSNFNCGYYINREKLYDILRTKYNLHCIYDPCSYPGIQCTFNYNPDIITQSGSPISEEKKLLYKNVFGVSFMIFRTGSVLIVGKCIESVLMEIYEFLKNILKNEYKEIGQRPCLHDSQILKDKKKKIRRKQITISVTSPAIINAM